MVSQISSTAATSSRDRAWVAEARSGCTFPTPSTGGVKAAGANGMAGGGTACAALAKTTGSSSFVRAGFGMGRSPTRRPLKLIVDSIGAAGAVGIAGASGAAGAA